MKTMSKTIFIYVIWWTKKKVTWSNKSIYCSLSPWHVKPCRHTIEEAHLRQISWLDCRWNLNSSYFKPNIWYKAHIDVKLTSGAFGWTSPVDAKIEMPDGSKQESLIKLDRRENVGFAISLGKFIITNSTTSGVIQFGFYNHETKWKSGLIIRALVVDILTDE